jgi:hypothetical protein
MKRLVLYPFLFVMYSVLNPLVYNLEHIDPSQAARPLGVLLLAAVLITCGLWLLVKNWAYAGYLTFLVLLFSLVFGHLQHLIQLWMPQQDFRSVSLMLLIAWGSLVFGIGFWVWRRFGNQASFTTALNLILTLLLVIPAAQASGELITTAQEETQVDLLVIDIVPSLDCSEHPDIYYIVVDAYGRADVLEELYGLENEAFLSFLEEQGFYVARQSATNYTQTIYSIPSALNFTFIESNPEGISSREYFSSLVADNRLLHALESCGYQTIALESGFFFTENPQVDLYLEEDGGLNEFESMLVADSPLEVVADDLNLEIPDYSHEAHRERVLYSFEQLRALPEVAGPKFIFAHILTPHPPFVFDAQGGSVEPMGSFTIMDGDDYRGSWQEYRTGFPAQVQHANLQLQETITAILENSERPPVIILQSDHGPGGMLNWYSPSETCLWERTSILNAYYLPGNETEQLYPAISPINSFRVVLNAYFGTKLPLLPDRTFFTSHRLDRQVIDVTELRASRQNCAWPIEVGED